MDINSFILSIVTSLGGAAAMTLLILKVLGQKFLDAQFEKGIENFKYKIASKFDRVSKIHEREYEILPKLWSSILDTNTKIHLITKPFQEYPDLKSMSESEINETYASYQLKESEIEKLNNSPQKSKDFIEILFWKNYNSANKHIGIFDEIFQNNRIFLIKEIENNLNLIRKSYIDMIIDIKMSNFENRIDYTKLYDVHNKLDELVPIVTEVGNQIQKRLGFDEVI